MHWKNASAERKIKFLKWCPQSKCSHLTNSLICLFPDLELNLKRLYFFPFVKSLCPESKSSHLTNSLICLFSRSQHFLAGDEPDPKSCCGVTVSQTVSIRWFIVMIAFVGICCSIVGTVLGAMKASGREHLTVSLLMIGKDSHKAF